MDVTPTILHLAGLPVPKGLDGRVLEEIFTPEFTEANPIEYGGEDGEGEFPQPGQSSMTENEEEGIREQLRGLGYIE